MKKETKELWSKIGKGALTVACPIGAIVYDNKDAITNKAKENHEKFIEKKAEEAERKDKLKILKENRKVALKNVRQTYADALQKLDESEE